MNKTKLFFDEILKLPCHVYTWELSIGSTHVSLACPAGNLELEGQRLLVGSGLDASLSFEVAAWSLRKSDSADGSSVYAVTSPDGTEITLTCRP